MSKDDWDDLWDKVLADGVQSVFDEPSSTHVSEFLSGDDNVFRGVALAAVDREELCTWLTKFALAVMSRLCERFPEDDMKVLQALEIFNPLRAPLDPAQLETYGDTEIDMLCSHYGKPKQVDSKVFPAMADPDQLKVEWRLLKHTLSKARAEASDSTAASDLIASLLDDDAAMENTTILMQIRQVLVWTTAMCERGFSQMKLIKSALRNRLYIETLDALMTISLVGPDYVSNQDDGIFKEALSEWQ